VKKTGLVALSMVYLNYWSTERAFSLGIPVNSIDRSIFDFPIVPAYWQLTQELLIAIRDLLL